MQADNYTHDEEMTTKFPSNTPTGEHSTDYSEPDQQPNGFPSAAELFNSTKNRLLSAERLLLDPTPDRVYEAEQLLSEAADFIRALEPGNPSAEAGSREELLVLRSMLVRLLALLNGALRIYWHRMRRTGLYIETYTPGGKTKVCLHRRPSLDVEV